MIVRWVEVEVLVCAEAASVMMRCRPRTVRRKYQATCCDVATRRALFLFDMMTVEPYPLK